MKTLLIIVISAISTIWFVVGAVEFLSRMFPDASFFVVGGLVFTVVLLGVLLGFGMARALARASRRS